MFLDHPGCGGVIGSVEAKPNPFPLGKKLQEYTNKCEVYIRIAPTHLEAKDDCFEDLLRKPANFTFYAIFTLVLCAFTVWSRTLIGYRLKL